MHRADHDGDDEGAQARLDEHFEVAMEEVSHVMRRLIEEAVHAAISEAMVQRNEGEPADGMVVVDTEGNHLEVLSGEEDVIEVDILMEEDQDEGYEEDEEEGRRFKVMEKRRRRGMDGTSAK